MKKIRILVIMLAALMFVGCSGNSGSNEVSDGEEKLVIGISQFAQHPSLDNCRIGFIEGLKENGFEDGKNVEFKIQNADASTDTATQIAMNFVKSDSDMIVAIATPSAMSGFNQTMNTDIPLIYTAINDPIGAQLANEDGTPTGNTTGTSDALPVEEQLKMIREILPEAKTIGILYTTSEANSISTIEIYKELAPKYDFELEIEGITASSDIPLATDNILGKVDCLTNLTDNTVVNSLPTILNKAGEKNIPVFGSEIEQVKIGCLAAEGIDYIELGKKTGEMAARILKGEKSASEMNFETIENSNLYINKKVAEDLEIDIKDSTLDRAVEVFKEISN